ncbi:MAG TPA: TonB-dependent receptor [Burkholderiaceae bacterium]|nr:TonB-dependent receptor [Burkholderiaceae bacterium]
MCRRRFDSSFSVILSCFLLLPATAYSSADHAQRLEAVRVKGNATSLERDIDAARAELERVAGNVSVIPADQYREGVVLGLQEAFASVPGVYARNPSGQVSARLSIRGSGISATSGLRGIRLLRDGLPLGRIDDFGDTIYADPANADYIELYRGANSLQYGAATLGGAINLVSPTGYTHAGAAWRMEAGPDGYVKGQARAGQVFDNGLDAYASISSMRTNGYRENSGHTVTRFYGNLGYRFNARSQGRLHLTSEHYRVQMPGPLTLGQLLDDPSAANPDNVRAGSRIRTTPRWHVAYQHDWRVGEADKLSMGVFHTGTRFISPTAGRVTHYDATDYGASLRHEINREHNGRKHRFVWGANYGRGSSDNQAYLPDDWPRLPYLPAPGSQVVSIGASRSSFELFAENSVDISSDVALIVGTQAAWAERRTTNKVSPIASAFFAGGKSSDRYFGLSPKLGLLWDIRPQAQVFANISRSFEPPNSLAFYTQEGNLEAQRATTLEVGTRGGGKGFGWDAAVYHAWIRNELVEFPLVAYPGAIIARNADRTRHIGLELGLHGELPLARMPGTIEWNVAYTWSRFRFNRDAVYGNNALPGIPQHVARLGLVYRHPKGYYAGPSIELASSANVDQANTLRAPGYGIVNFTLGYKDPADRYRLFIDARNLANKYYVATTDYVVDANSRDRAVFYPGQTRSVYIGFEANW